MNFRAVRAIYLFEMARTWRTLLQSIVSPVVSTSLYFVVFGSAIGSRMTEVHGVPYGAFIVPGLIMLSILTESVSNASFGIYIFAGPVQQALLWLFPAISPVVLTLVAFAIVLPLAIASWRFVEKPSLQLRPVVTNWIRTTGRRAQPISG